MKIRSWSKLPKWAQQDLQDMYDSRQTSFERCRKCGRIYDTGYRCPYCGHDDSARLAPH
jgi:rRNA maturation endonuclease Nob1